WHWRNAARPRWSALMDSTLSRAEAGWSELSSSVPRHVDRAASSASCQAQAVLNTIAARTLEYLPRASALPGMSRSPTSAMAPSPARQSDWLEQTGYGQIRGRIRAILLRCACPPRLRRARRAAQDKLRGPAQPQG